MQPEKSLVAHKLPDFANAIQANPDYIRSHVFESGDRDPGWVVVGGKEVLAHWRDNSVCSGCSARHLVSDMLAHANAVKAGLRFGYLFYFFGGP